MTNPLIDHLRLELDALTRRSESKEYSEFMRVYSAGHPCSRKLWMQFRYVLTTEFSDKTLKIFERGHKIESEIIEKLRQLKGVIVLESQSIYREGWVQGHSDVVIQHNDKKTIVEIKGFNLKNFKDVVKNGITKSRPEHYVQIELYMKLSGIHDAIYLVHCKDNEEIYLENIKYDDNFATAQLKKLEGMANSNIPPGKFSEHQFVCKGGMGYGKCDFFEVCHGYKGINQSCRTCSNLEFKNDITAYCNKREKKIEFKNSKGAYPQIFIQNEQRNCSYYSMIDGLQNENEETLRIKQELIEAFGKDVREFRK